MKLDDLDNDCLLNVLNQLSLEDLFKLRRVNKQLKAVAEAKMRVKIQAIALYESNMLFSECTHFDADVKDQVLVLESLFKKRFCNYLFREPSKRAHFLSMLSIFSDIKSIDFGQLQVEGDLLLEVVKRCPELQCLKLSYFCVKEEDWERVLDQVGCQIIHFANRIPFEIDEDIAQNFYRLFSKKSQEISLLSLISAKCGNIQQVDWLIEGSPTSDLFAAFKTLPKSCRVALGCDSFKGFLRNDFSELEDVVDELHVKTLDWPALKNRYDKLSSIKIFRLYPSPARGVDFAGLKKLDLSEWKECYDVRCWVASQFSLLEDFCFSASGGLAEDDFETLFPKMTTVNKLTIVSTFNRVYPFLLPESAILHLKNLDTIDLDIFGVPRSFQYIDFLQKIEWYVNQIRLLKKLTVDMRHLDCHYLWEWLIANKVNQLKSKQSRVHIELFVRP